MVKSRLAQRCNSRVSPSRTTGRPEPQHADRAWLAGACELVLIPLFAACTPAQSVSPSSTAPMSASVPAEPELRERVAKWWTARQQRDHAVMYELYEPAYRGRVDMKSFLQESLIRTRIDVTSYAIQEITPKSGATAQVKLELAAQLPRGSAPYSSIVEDSWILVSGSWYKVYQPAAPPFPVVGGSVPVAK